MELYDDDLSRFEANGAAPLPITNDQGYVDHDGARIWYATYGQGLPVILLHGGLGHSGNWGYQIPALIESGYRAIVVDSRGHGHSTRDSRPYSYELLAGGVLNATWIVERVFATDVYFKLDTSTFADTTHILIPL